MRYCYLLIIGVLACAKVDNKATRVQSEAADQKELGQISTLTKPSDTADCGIGPVTPLTGDGLGVLRIGAPVYEIRRKCRIVRDTLELDEEARPGRVVTLETVQGLVTADIDNDKVWRITPLSSTFHTADSLGFGSTLSKLLTVSDASGIEAEGALYVVLKAHCGLSFRLGYDIPEASHRSEWSLRNLSRIRGSTLVDQVFATGCQGSKQVSHK